MTRPNIVLIMTDQQRYDTIRALGYELMITPNLDRLAQEGFSFRRTYCTAPSCCPSRASFFNGQFAHTTRVFKNQQPWERSWVETLRDNGYHTVSIGKMHTIPYDAPCGFDQRFVVENKDRPMEMTHPHGPFYDEWDKYLAGNGIRKPSKFTYKADHPEAYDAALGAFEWPLEERYHPDVFVGNTAKWYIEQRRSPSPFFLQVGFPGPHPPYDPPKRLIERYADIDTAVPRVTDEERAGQPLPQADLRRQMQEHELDAVKWIDRPSDQQLSKLRKHYSANVTLIDEKIGEIIDALDSGGYLDNSIIIFTSDHGDCLGDHGHIQKWTMYEPVVRVPMIVRAPGRLPAGGSSDALIQHMDIAATLFDMIGIPFPEGRDAISLLPNPEEGRRYVFAEHAKDLRLQEIKYMTMVRDKDYKLVHYLDQPWGELYDLNADPDERRNLWDDGGYTAVQRRLLDAIRDWRIRCSLPHVQSFHGFYS